MISLIIESENVLYYFGYQGFLKGKRKLGQHHKILHEVKTQLKFFSSYNSLLKVDNLIF